LFEGIITEHAFVCQVDIATFPKLAALPASFSQTPSNSALHSGALPSLSGCVRIGVNAFRETLKRRRALEPSELAHVIVDKLEDHQAVEIVMLDLREITPLADYFVICTADSDRQARMLQETLEEELKREHSVRPLSTEGEPASGWVLLDYNAVVVHIFSRHGRAYYRLEEVWKAAPVVLKIQ